MYAYLYGEPAGIEEEYAEIDVGGVGYKVYMPARSLFALQTLNNKVKVFTHLVVREDAFDLFGFLSKEDKSMFLMLISVSGVGPKAALSILNTLSPEEFAIAAATGDSKAISRSHGVGPKLSQRIILELKDKVAKENIEVYKSEGIQAGANIQQEAVNALFVLGYSNAAAKKAVYESTGNSVEDLIKDALKKLM